MEKKKKAHFREHNTSFGNAAQDRGNQSAGKRKWRVSRRETEQNIKVIDNRGEARKAGSPKERSNQRREERGTPCADKFPKQSHKAE